MSSAGGAGYVLLREGPRHCSLCKSGCVQCNETELPVYNYSLTSYGGCFLNAFSKARTDRDERTRHWYHAVLIVKRKFGDTTGSATALEFERWVVCNIYLYFLPAAASVEWRNADEVDDDIVPEEDSEESAQSDASARGWLPDTDSDDGRFA